MWYEIELAVRFLRRRSGGLLRPTSWAALGGVALGTASLLITLALMTGYQSAIARALAAGNAHMVALSPGPLSIAEGADLAQRLRAVDGVVRAAEVTYVTGLAEDPADSSRPLPIVLKAVSTPPPFSGLEEWPRSSELPPVVLGQRLMERLQLEDGDPLTVRLPPKRGSWLVPAIRVQVAGSFQLAFSEFDERWLLMPLPDLLAADDSYGVAGVEVEVRDPMAVGEVRARVEAAAAESVVTDWREMNAALFAALRWQTVSLFVVLSLVVAVASFQVSSAMVVLAIEKRRSTGVLQALGLPVRRLRRLLALVGTLLGCVGVGTGLAAGSAACFVLTWLRVVRFPPDLAEVYMVDSIPFVLAPLPTLAVALVGLMLVWVASLWPAWRAARIEPVQALKAV